MNNKGYLLKFGQGSCVVKNQSGDHVATCRQSKGNLFYLDSMEGACLIASVKRETNKICLVNKEDNSWLWHKRLCHINFDSIVKVSKKKSVRGLLEITKPDRGICKDCQLGKLIGTSFSSKSFSAENVLDLVHRFVWTYENKELLWRHVFHAFCR